MLKLCLFSIFFTIASSYDLNRVHCPWSEDGKTQLVYNGVECVEPPQQRFIQRVVQRKDQTFQCPESEGYYRCPESDSNYYCCRKGVPRLESCPTGTVFDGRDACIERTSVGRQSGDQKSFKCPKSRGKFRVARSVSNQYYQCSRNRPRLRTCPQQQYFDGRGCSTVRRQVRPQRQQFQCPADNGVYADQRDNCCFWVCRNRTPSRGRCPPQQCGCVNTWHQVSGVIIHKDNCNQVIDTWNQQTGQWDRSYRPLYDHGQCYEQPRFVYTDDKQQQGIPGYPVDDARAMAESMLGDDDYNYK